jgi:tRNA dimethylallyltransferase
MNDNKYDLLVITGPTASGKTKLAAKLAKEISGEIISADSRQVYRRMDIGTGKDIDDYWIDGVEIPYHLIDITEPGEQYNVYNFVIDFIRVYNDIKSRNKVPVLCGGTGLYVSAVTMGYEFYEGEPDEKLRDELGKKSIEELQGMVLEKGIKLNDSDFKNKRRLIRAIESARSNARYEKIKVPDLNSLIVAIDISREERRKKIHNRLLQRLQEGMIEEVKALLNDVGKDVLLSYGLEYKWITLFLTGELSYDEMVQKLETEINRFAKRQMTWFRGMERKGVEIHWINADLPIDEKIKKIKDLWYSKD